MKHIAWIFWLIMAPLLVAAEKETAVRVRPDQSDQTVELRFPQPLVSHTTVENCRQMMNSGGALLERDEEDWEDDEEEENEGEEGDIDIDLGDKKYTPGDLGLDIFTISGDDKHKPIARWIDQDRLEIRFAEGTSCRTEYKFQLKPGTKYLGGEAAPAEPVAFRCPVDTLSGHPFMDDRGVGIMVCARHQITRESRELSAQYAPRFVFREAHEKLMSGKTYYTTTVEAVAEPACLKQGIESRTLQVLQEYGEDVWQNLREDSPLPGHVVLRPQKPLDPEKEWHLLVVPGEHGGFDNKYPVCESATPMAELGTGVKWTFDAEKKSYHFQVFFSNPMSLADMPALFDRMQLEVGGKAAVKSGQGTKKVQLPNREIEFRYAGVIELPVVECHYYRARPGRTPDMLTYTPLGQARGFTVEVSATSPELLDVVLPAGTASYLGFKTQSEHRHRIALNPIWPELAPGSHTVLPLKGDRSLRVPYANLSELRVNAWRLAHEMTATAFAHDLSNGSEVPAAMLKNDVLRSREWRGMAVQSHELEAASYALKSARERERYRAARSRKVLQGATAFPGCSVPTGTEGMVSSGEVVLNLDAATGGPAAPGMYLLRLQKVANAQVRAALRRMERAEESLDNTQDVLVQVTDLNVTIGQEAVLVNRYSDGQPVEKGTISYLDEDNKVHQLSIENGIAWLPDEMGGGNKAWVRSGEDVVLVQLPYRSRYHRLLHPHKDKTSTLLVLDRPLYRPGDTVYVRGVLRRTLPDGSCALPTEKTAKLTFYRPDGTELDTRDVSLGEYGAFETRYTLPVGEDDVTGHYNLRVEAGDFRTGTSVNCQVFRRDAFKVSLEIEAEPVAPEEYKVRVAAVDYSGTPLANATCELDIDYDDKVTLTLDAEGKAEISRKVTKTLRDVGRIEVSGSVSNDREEYVRIGSKSKSIHKGDFYISVRDNRVVLLDSRTDKALAREQNLNLRLIDEEVKPKPGANGLGFKDLQKIERWSGELVIPADCELGVPLPDNESWRGKADYWMITGSDTAGRSVSCQHHLWYYRRSDSVPDIKFSLKDGQVELLAELPHAGTAHLFVGQMQKLRHLTLPVQAGKQTLRVPLQADEEGSLSFTLVLPGQKPGDAATVTNGSGFVPIQKYKLDVQMQVPQEACRPAQSITLSGCVQAEGKPADAEVTLYAVDEGMLSVAPYHYPDPEAYFFSNTVRRFSLSHYGVRNTGKGLLRQLMPTFWRGDLMGCGYSLSPYPTLYAYKGGKRTFLLGGPLKRMGRLTVNAMGGAVETVMGLGEQRQYAAAEACMPAPAPIMTAGLTSGSKKMKSVKRAASNAAYAVEADACDEAAAEDGELDESLDDEGAEEEPYLRTNFTPVAVWQGALRTDAGGRFSVDVTLPDTLTTYQVIAMAVDRSGKRFGSARKEIKVNQPVMLTPGTPLFMSLGDSLRLPLSIVNNTDEPGTWRVTLEGAETPQEITLAARQSGTLYFVFNATAEGEQTLRWTAQGKPGSDAVQGEFAVRFPAPVLKEVHRLTLSAGDASVTLASLLGSDVATAARGEMELVASANPVLHLAGAADFLLSYPYGCTEQRSSALIPWLLYDHLAPFCPKMAQTRPDEVKKVVKLVIEDLLPRQCEDGGLSFWGGWNKSCLWATAHAGYVLKLAQEQGYEVPQEAMDKLYRYLWWASVSKESYRTRFAIARTRGKTGEMKDILRDALAKDEEKDFLYRETKASMQFMLSMLENPDGADDAFRTWLRSTGRDYRHGTTQGNAWNLFALVEYLKLKKGQGDEATLALQDGTTIKLDKGATTVPLPWQPGQEMKTLPTAISAQQGTVYATLRVRALPPTTDYPGVTERGLQVTRLYETKGADGVWRPATSFKVGDVVRVTLTCAKVADELKYLVLEDYMPACMEAINPNVPGQSAGLEPLEWSFWFDHREYLADRVRGFCTRWEGRDLLNMRYYARVKRAGTSAAPPAQAQLMYEPQVYGLSPNARITSEP